MPGQILTPEESLRCKPETERLLGPSKLSPTLLWRMTLSVGRGGRSRLPVDHVLIGGFGRFASRACAIEGRVGSPAFIIGLFCINEPGGRTWLGAMSGVLGLPSIPGLSGD